MRNTPYVGITGIRTPEDAVHAADSFEKNGFSQKSEHIGMIGVLTASDERYRGLSAASRHIENVEELAGIFSVVRGRVLPMLHIEISKEPGNAAPFAGDIAGILEKSGVYEQNLCRHVQLNGFPSVTETKALLRDFPELSLVLQIRKELVARGGDEILRTLDEHDDAFAYALLDPSAGTGTVFDIDQAAKIYGQISRSRPDVSLGFAGGFRPENTQDRVRRLRDATGTSAWCIDIEENVRTAADALSPMKVEAYIWAARGGFSLSREP